MISEETCFWQIERATSIEQTAFSVVPYTYASPTLVSHAGAPSWPVCCFVLVH